MTGEAMVDGLLKAVEEQEQEIARLNKIIDELEKHLTTNIRHSADRHVYGNVYYKLQELKEEGK